MDSDRWRAELRRFARDVGWCVGHFYFRAKKLDQEGRYEAANALRYAAKKIEAVAEHGVVDVDAIEIDPIWAREVWAEN